MSAAENTALVRRLLDRIRDKGTWDETVMAEFFAPHYYRLTIRGPHRGSFLGVPPTQTHVTVSFLAIARIENDQIAEECLLRQLGAAGVGD